MVLALGVDVMTSGNHIWAKKEIIEYIVKENLLLRPANYAHAAFTTSMRVSNAKARRELGWAPSVPTWRQGVPLIAAARRNAA